MHVRVGIVLVVDYIGRKPAKLAKESKSATRTVLAPAQERHPQPSRRPYIHRNLLQAPRTLE